MTGAGDEREAGAAVSIFAGGFTVDAMLVGAAFGIAPANVPEQMRAGEITSCYETGIGEDEGRFRLTFFHAGKTLRLTVDAGGAILARATFPTPQAARPVRLIAGPPARTPI